MRKIGIKTIILMLILSLMVLSLAACGAKEKSEPESGSGAAAVQNTETDAATDANAEASDSEQDQTTPAADLPDWWPDTELAKEIPGFSQGSFMNVMDIDNGFIIALEKVEASDYDAYLKTIKDGFSKNATEANDSGMYTYVGSNKDGVKVSLIYDANAKTFHISAEEE